jgi:hypothetical protein
LLIIDHAVGTEPFMECRDRLLIVRRRQLEHVLRV